jgi:hypothetical protein
MCTLLIAILVDIALVLIFYADNGVFRSGAKYFVKYETFPHYVHTYELITALSAGSLGLIFSQVDKLQKYGVSAYPVMYATWAYIAAIVLSMLFILFFIRNIEVSTAVGNSPTDRSSTKFQFCINMFLAISALAAFVTGFAYAAESMRAITIAVH